MATRSPQIIAGKARELFQQRFDWWMPVRAVTIRAINLSPQEDPQQLDFFTDAQRLDRLDRLETAVEDIRRRFGKHAVTAATLMGDLKMPGRGIHEVVMPGLMYR